MNRVKEAGFTLIEITMVLAIVGIMMVFCAHLFITARFNAQVTTSLTQMKTIVQDSYTWLDQQPQADFAGNDNAISLQKLIDDRLLSPHDQYAPWPGSTVAVAPDLNNPNHLRIALSHIPVSACQSLAARLNSISFAHTAVGNCGKSGSTDFYGVF